MSKDKPCRGDTLLDDRKQLPGHRTVGVVGGDTNNMESVVRCFKGIVNMCRIIFFKALLAGT